MSGKWQQEEAAGNDDPNLVTDLLTLLQLFSHRIELLRPNDSNGKCVLKFQVMDARESPKRKSRRNLVANYMGQVSVEGVQPLEDPSRFVFTPKKAGQGYNLGTGLHGT